MHTLHFNAIFCATYSREHIRRIPKGTKLLLLWRAQRVELRLNLPGRTTGTAVVVNVNVNQAPSTRTWEDGAKMSCSESNLPSRTQNNLKRLVKSVTVVTNFNSRLNLVSSGNSTTFGTNQRLLNRPSSPYKLHTRTFHIFGSREYFREIGLCG